MSTEKPRRQVNDLGPLNQLMPAADPRTADTYQRPGSQEVMRPNLSNPMTQLAESLGTLNAELKTSLPKIAQQYSEKEYADAEKSFYENREKANEMIRTGQFPAGASPYWQRGLQRASLKQHGQLLAAQLQQDFMGEAGSEARASNDPAVVQRFVDSVASKYSAENLRAGDRSLYSALDLQEIFNPAMEQAGKSLLSAHAQYRVNENQQQYVDLAGATVETLLEQHISTLKATDSDEDRARVYREAGVKINDVFYNFDTGLVKNGLAPSKGNQLIVDTITAKAMKTGDRSFLDVLDHVPAGNGASVGKTQAAQAKRLQAEEHITREEIQRENHRWQLEQRPYQREALHRQAAEFTQQDQRWEKERMSWLETSAGKAEGEILRSLTRRLYEGMDNPDPKKGVAVINDVLKTAKQSLPEKVEVLNELLAVTHQRKAHTQDDPSTVSKIYLDIAKDPLGFDDRRLAREVRNGNLTVGTMRGIFDDLDRKRNNASHPLMRQPEFTEMLHQVGRGSVGSPDDEWSAEGQLRASQAVNAFRDEAQMWIEANPNGSPAAFRQHLRQKVAPVLEMVNKDYGEAKAKDRETEATKQKQAKEQAAKEQAEKKAQEQSQMKADVTNFARSVEEGKRQQELDRLKQHESQPRMNDGEFSRWLRGERVDTHQGPRMDDKTSRFFDWLKGIKQEPASQKREPIKAEQFGKLLDEVQRKAVMSATPEERRATLVQLLGGSFMERGQSAEDMRREIDVFLSRLPVSGANSASK